MAMWDWSALLPAGWLVVSSVLMAAGAPLMPQEQAARQVLQQTLVKGAIGVAIAQLGILLLALPEGRRTLTKLAFWVLCLLFDKGDSI